MKSLSPELILYNLGEIRYLGVPDITDYKLEYVTQKLKAT